MEPPATLFATSLVLLLLVHRPPAAHAYYDNEGRLINDFYTTDVGEPLNQPYVEAHPLTLANVCVKKPWPNCESDLRAFAVLSPGPYENVDGTLNALDTERMGWAVPAHGDIDLDGDELDIVVGHVDGYLELFVHTEKGITFKQWLNSEGPDGTFAAKVPNPFAVSSRLCAAF